MPLSVDNIVQSGTGSFEGSSGTITLPASTTAGSLILVCAANTGDGTNNFAVDIPTGGAGVFTVLSQGTGIFARAAAVQFVQVNVAAGETSWAVTVINGTQQVVWAVYELTGVGLSPADGYSVAQTDVGSDGTSLGASITTGHIPGLSTRITECYDTLGVAVFAATSADTTPPVISNITDGFYSQAEVGRVNATRAVTMTVAFRSILNIGRFSAAAAVSPSSYGNAVICGLYADGGRWAPNIDLMTGFEFGTVTGITSGSAIGPGSGNGSPPFDASAGTPEIVTTNARTGGAYCLKLSSSAAVENVSWGNPGALAYMGSSWNNHAAVARFHVFFDTSLPGGDVELFAIEAGSAANGMKIRYRTASQKLGVQIGSGTEILSDAAVAAGKWIGVDVRYDPRTTTHLCDWQVDYDSLDGTVAPVAQTQASTSGLTGTGSSDITTLRLGWSVSTTATVYYDDVLLSRFWGTYPLGDMRIVPLRPDPAGTPTTTNDSLFKVFTSNGSMATFTAAGARAALDDIPPTIGASADGVAQVTVGTDADLVTIPMETYTCAPLYSPRAVRWYLAGWAASGNPATLGIKTVDPDDATTIVEIGAGDHGFDSSAVVWLCVMHRRAGSPGTTFYQMTQSRVDALAMQFGRTNDANPDVGLHCVLAELAIQPAAAIGIYESGGHQLYVRQDPNNQAVISYVVTTPAGTRGATLTYALSGVDQTPIYVGPNTVYELSIGAASIDTVTSVGLAPDPDLG